MARYLVTVARPAVSLATFEIEADSEESARVRTLAGYGNIVGADCQELRDYQESGRGHAYLVPTVVDSSVIP